MKRLFSISAILLISIMVSAQLDRSTPPDPEPAPEVQIGDYKKFTLKNGLTVIVVENNKVPVLSYSLTLDVTLPRENEAAGYIDLAGELLRSGTTNRSKTEIDEAIDFIGATLSTHSKGIYGRSLTKHSDNLLEIMSDVLLNPAFAQEELDKLIKQYKTGIQANKEEPRAIAQNVARTLVYGKDDPYGEIMTEETLDNITTDKCRNFYETYFRPNEGYLVIVGDISVRKAKKQARKYFGDWEKAPVPKNSFDYPDTYSEPKVAIANKDGANQSTIMVTHDIKLTPGHPDAVKVRVMNQILGGGSFNARLFQNLREDKGYTYGAYSNLESDERVGRFTASAQVRTSVTDSALTQILLEMEKLRDEPVNDDELQLVKNVLAGSFGRSLEDPQTVARFALNIERYDLPDDYYETYLQKVESVTKEDVHAMSGKYLNPDGAVIIAVGNVAAIEEKMKSFSPSKTVTQYDYYGNPVERKEVSKDISAQSIIDSYIEAIGGEEKLKSVEDLKMEMTMNMEAQGMTLQIKSYRKAPNKAYTQISAQGNVFSTHIFDGQRGKVKSPMGEQMPEGEALTQMKENAVMFPELTLDNEGVEMEVDGIETVDGKETYKIVVTKTSGNTSTFFYGVEDGLKYKEIMQSVQGPISVTYSDYQTVQGIKFPGAIKQVVGPQTLDMDIKSIAVNEGVDDSLFVID
jgi:zinc protease